MSHVLAKPPFKVETLCRLCQQGGLRPILDLGMQPLANALPSAPQRAQPAEVYPLHFSRCGHCGLVQILETVEPAKLFNEYLYFSSYSQILVDNAAALSQNLIKSSGLKAQDLIVEIGSNDGYLLQFYKQAGLRVLGVEPAANVAKVAIKTRDVATRVSFFNESIAAEIRRKEGPAQVIHANNVLAHTASLHSVIEGIAALLADSGIGVFEFAYVLDMVKSGSFDMIYHEHLCYYSLATFERLLQMHDLAVFDVEHISTHGGSLRVYASRPGKYPSSTRLAELREQELACAAHKDIFYTRFADSILALKDQVMGLLEDIGSRGEMAAAYGAAAKATVMLNYFGIDDNRLQYMVDRSPHKQGHFVPGTNLKIYPTEKLQQNRPEYLFLTAWNLAGEIIKQLRGYQQQGGKFIVPLPKLTVC